MRTEKPAKGPRPVVLMLIALWFLWAFGFQTLWVRLNLQLEGTVITSRDIPATGAPRYRTDYEIMAPSGKSETYSAGATDASLPRSLPVGSYLFKKRWDWDAQINGKVRKDPAYVIYLVLVGVAFTVLIWSFYSWYSPHPSRT